MWFHRVQYKKENKDRPRSRLIALEKAVPARRARGPVGETGERRCPDPHGVGGVWDCYIVHGRLTLYLDCDRKTKEGRLGG